MSKALSPVVWGAASLLEFRFEIDQLYVALAELLAYGALLIEYRCPEAMC